MILDIKHLRLAYGAHVLAPDVTSPAPTAAGKVPC